MLAHPPETLRSARPFSTRAISAAGDFSRFVLIANPNLVDAVSRQPLVQPRAQSSLPQAAQAWAQCKPPLPNCLPASGIYAIGCAGGRALCPSSGITAAVDGCNANRWMLFAIVVEEPMSHPVVHFEIGCKDKENTSAFYRRVFGWSIDPGPMGMIDTESTGNLTGISRRSATNLTSSPTSTSKPATSRNRSRK